MSNKAVDEELIVSEFLLVYVGAIWSQLRDVEFVVQQVVRQVAKEVISSTKDLADTNRAKPRRVE